jgi:hypothetical protein
MLQRQCEPSATGLPPMICFSKSPFVSFYFHIFRVTLTLAIASLGPRYSDPIAMAFNKRGCVHSRKTNVGRCRMGKVGTKRTKNMCKHSSRKTDVIEVALTASVTLEDWIDYNERMYPSRRGRLSTYEAGHHFRHIAHRLMTLPRWDGAHGSASIGERAGRAKIGYLVNHGEEG